jgi:signal transduction histidine kinase
MAWQGLRRLSRRKGSGMGKVDFLRSVPLLFGLPDEALAELAQAAREQRYAPGEIVVREGDPEDTLFIIKSGRVDIIKGHGTSHQEKIAERHSLDVIGEMSLLEQKPRFATVVAREPVVVLSIASPPFVEVAKEHPIVLSRLGTIMSGKTREAGEDLYRELLRRQQEVSELANLQKAFLSVVSHELKTPVANLLLSLEVLRRVDPASLSRQQLRGRFADFNHNVQLLKQRIDGMVDYATLIGNQGEMFRRQVDFAALARQVGRKLEPRAAQAGLKLEQKIAAEPLPLWGDRRRLAEAMSHLLDNAIKFNRPGGLAVVMAWEERDTARYEVADTGEGIPADRLEHLWEPFTQMADALKRGVEGLGLGLALTRYIVRAHGGEVWAESEEGRGSKFGFWVPKRLEENP